LRRNEFCIKEISDITGLSYEAVEAIGKGKDYVERLFEDYYKEAFEDGYKQGLKKGLDKGTEEEKDKIAKELSKLGHPLRFTEPLN
jgi:flagellar biosynthesis/type III secretory pathway protein FliH